MTKKHLAIEINTRAVRFTKLDGSFVVGQNEFNFTDQQDHRFAQQLSSFMEEASIREMDADEFSLAFCSSKSTIVPTNVFNESNAASILELSFGDDFISNEIEYNRLIDPNIVNVHQLPFWIKSFFVVKFPRIVIQHEGTHLLRGIFKGTTFKLKATITLHDDFFSLIIVKENKLQFYSYFEYSNQDDVLYYLSFVLQQLKWNDTPFELVLTKGVGATIHPNELIENFKPVLHKDVKYTIEEALLSKYQELCV